MRTTRHILKIHGALYAAFLIWMPPMTSQSAKLTSLHAFKGPPDGAQPTARVVIGPDRVLYGTTDWGGTGTCTGGLGCGTVFSLTPPGSSGSSWTESVYSSVLGRGGANPFGGVAIGGAGLIYGATSSGGLANEGTVFVLKPPAMAGGAVNARVIHEFTGYPGDGGEPEGSLTIGNGGVLYGTTTLGGSTDAGAVFSLTPPTVPGGSWSEILLHSFACCNTDGGGPQTGVTIGSGGVLYGTTSLGPLDSPGMVYSLTPPEAPGDPWTETILHVFGAPNDGSEIYYSGVAIGSGGVLYGTTAFGGASNNGTVYSLTPPASPGGPWSEAVLYSFAGGSDGFNPYGGVTVGSGGVLYGTTSSGGAGIYCGTVFSLTPPATTGGTWTNTVLHRFTGSDGCLPYAGVTIGSGGVLFGTTNAGGIWGKGNVFSLRP